MFVLGIDPGLTRCGYGCIDGSGARQRAVAGYGAATKQQVQQMVKQLLGLTEVPRPPDAADALALAICHLSSVRGTELRETATSPMSRQALA